MRVLVSQSCFILCDPKDRSFPGSSVSGILQARIRCVCVCVCMYVCVYVHITESLYCKPKTNTTCKSTVLQF